MSSWVYRPNLFLAVGCLGAVATAAGAGCDSSASSVGCEKIDCGDFGSCIEVDGKGMCDCDAGYVDWEGFCIPDPCGESPCVHGTCRPSGRDTACDCDAGYAGMLCDNCAPGYHQDGLSCVSGSPCEYDPCAYGTCVSVDGAPTCDCFNGYTGELCERCAPGFHADNLRCVSDMACIPDPCVYGSCSLKDGHAVCTCDSGYDGPRCDRCAAGFHEEGLGCVPDIGGPCDPNPCEEENRRICVVVGDSHRCDCNDGYHDDGGACVPDSPACVANPCAPPKTKCVDDGAGGRTCECPDGYSGATCATCAAGYQDNDHNGTCKATCATAGLDCGTLPCLDTSGEATCGGVRSCDVTVTFDPATKPGLTVTALYLRGELTSDWGLQNKFVKGSDGKYSLSVSDLAPGDYAYKLYEQGTNAWFEDPKNMHFKFVGGLRNSRLVVPDCTKPLLKLLGQPTVSGGSISFKVQYMDGAQGKGLDPATVQITRNGTALPLTFDATGVVTINDAGLSRDKYTYRFRASDKAGHAADLLYVPLWVEATPFQWQDAILYFVLTDRFNNGDPTNDLPKAGADPKAEWQGGDFKGIKAKIDEGYFDDLGVNAIWLSSVSMNTQGAWTGSYNKKYSGYHSYWPVSTGWREGYELAGVQPTEPHFGTLQELKDMVATAHAHGIRVLVDFATNHVHQDSPLCGDDPLTAQRCDAHSSWYYDAASPIMCAPEWKPSDYIFCWFDPFLPDINYTNLEITKLMTEHAVWLVQETDIDGFRVDALKHIIDELSYELRARIQESVVTTGVRFYMVGETFTAEDGAAAIKHYVSPEMLDGQFDFPLAWQVIEGFLREGRDFRPVETFLASNATYYGDWAVMSNFMGNHDMARALSHAAGYFSDQWGNKLYDGGLRREEAKWVGWNDPPSLPPDNGSGQPYSRLRMAWTFLMTLPGIPLIYYGDEFGMAGAGDPDNRRFMTPAASLNDEQRATLDHVKKLGIARRAHKAMRYAQRQKLLMDTSNGLLWAYGYSYGTADKVVVAFNRATSQQTLTIPVSSLNIANGTVLREVVHSTQAQEVTGTVSNGNLVVTLGGRDSAVFVTR